MSNRPCFLCDCYIDIEGRIFGEDEVTTCLFHPVHPIETLVNAWPIQGEAVSNFHYPCCGLVSEPIDFEISEDDWNYCENKTWNLYPFHAREGCLERAEHLLRASVLLINPNEQITHYLNLALTNDESEKKIEDESVEFTIRDGSGEFNISVLFVDELISILETEEVEDYDLVLFSGGVAYSEDEIELFHSKIGEFKRYIFWNRKYSEGADNVPLSGHRHRSIGSQDKMYAENMRTCTEEFKLLIKSVYALENDNSNTTRKHPPKKKYKCMISYSRSSDPGIWHFNTLAPAFIPTIATASHYYRAALQRGISVWMDKYSILPGADWLEDIRSAIEAVEYIIVNVTEHSIKSSHVKEEVEYGKSLGKVFLLVANNITAVEMKNYCTETFGQYFIHYSKGTPSMSKLITQLEMAKNGLEYYSTIEGKLAEFNKNMLPISSFDEAIDKAGVETIEINNVEKKPSVHVFASRVPYFFDLFKSSPRLEIGDPNLMLHFLDSALKADSV